MFCKSAEGTTGGGENEAGDFGASAGPEALMGAIVLGVDGEEFGAGSFGGGHDKRTAGDEDLFVGEPHSFAEFDGLVGGVQAGNTHDGGHDKVDFGGGGGTDEGIGAVKNVGNGGIFQKLEK